MPLVPSQAWLAEKLSAYQSSRHAPNSANGGSSRQGSTAGFSVSELIPAICSRILATDPALVADVAAGRAQRQALTDLIGRASEQESLRSAFYQADLQQQVMDFLFGYGPLQPFVENEDISDIDGTGAAEFCVRIRGERQALDLSFPSPQAFDTFCRLVIIRNGGVINENDSHCRVSDPRYRLRINVSVPPRSVRGALICIRKHRQKNLRLPDLVEEGMLDQRAARQLESWAAGGATVLFSGRGAAGKTTLLRAFLEALPKLERVLVAESDSELYPDKPGCLLLRVKKAQEGGRPVTLRDLVSDGLTMSLDTYCIGEIVGEEALEFIQAAFSGHRCLATIHADCAADALDRLLLLARPAGGSQDVKVLKRMLGRCIDYIVHLKDFAVEQILQVRGFLEGEDAYAMVTVWPENPCPAAGPAAGQPAVPLVPGQGGSAFCLCEMPGQRVGQSDAASGR